MSQSFSILFLSQKNTHTHTLKWELKDKVCAVETEGKDKLYFFLPYARFGRLSVPIPEVQNEFTEHAVNFQK